MAEQVGEHQPELSVDGDAVDEAPVDAMALYRQQAVAALAQDKGFVQKLRGDKGVTWMAVIVALEDKLPTQLQDRHQIAYDLVPSALDAILGPGQWESFKQAKKDG